jgi:HEAT repeat protein
VVALAAALGLFLQDDPSSAVRALIDRLRSEKVGERMEAVSRLKRLGRAARKELEEASKDGDAEVAGQARRLLRVLEVSEALTDALRKAFPGIEERLAAGGPAEWTETLEAAAASKVELAPGNLSILARFALRGPVPESIALRICAVITDRQPPLMDRELVALSAAESARVRSAAVVALVAVGSSETVPVSRKLLKDPDPLVRRTAVLALGECKATEAAGEVADFLADGDLGVRVCAVGSLAAMGAKPALPRIAPLLKDGIPAVRSSAVSAIEKLGDAGWLPRVLPLLADDEDSVREAAQRATESLFAPEHATALRDFLRHAGGDVRRSAAELHGRLDLKESVPDLLKLLEDPETTVRSQAARALGSLQALDSRATLEKLLEDPSFEVVGAAASALARIGSRKGVEVLLKEGRELHVLNALRTPEPWKRLSSIRAGKELRGFWMREQAGRLCERGGLKLDETEAGFPEDTDWNSDSGPGRPTIPEALNSLLGFGTPIPRYEFVLEADRVRVLPHDEALRFWQAWWEEEERKR